MGPFSVERVDGAPGEVTLALGGRLTFPDARALSEELRRRTMMLEHVKVVRFDLAKVEQADGAGLAVLVAAQAELECRAVKTELVGASGNLAELVKLYRDGDVECFSGRNRKAESALANVGRATIGLVKEAQLGFAFVGSVVVAAVRVVRNPRSANWREIAPLMEHAGANAVPIVLVINFLIGVVTAYHAAVQLKRFGATIYVADLVGLSITRELGPVMTAVVVTGRTGAAYAAELGSMKVSEEIDALVALGLDPLRFLVIPRVVALALMLPLLTLVGDAIGIIGGYVVAVLSLDMNGQAYFTETKSIVFTWDIFSGVIKSVAFAFAISLIACQQGLAAAGGASGVGRRTTSSVVSILFALIVIDALFTLLFQRQHG